jgi:hypothetical protein
VRRVKVRVQFDAPAIDQYYRHCAGTLKIPSATAAGYFDYDQPFAIASDVVGFYACSLESSLQRAQCHAVDSAKLASR